MSEASGLRSLKTGAMPASRYLYGRPKCLDIAHWRLTEVPLVLPIELAWTFVSHLEGCTGSIKFLCEHLLPCGMEPTLFLKLKGTHCGETTEMMMQS